MATDEARVTTALKAIQAFCVDNATAAVRDPSVWPKLLELRKLEQLLSDTLDHLEDVGYGRRACELADRCEELLDSLYDSGALDVAA